MTLFLVADPDQTLYRYQGAKPELPTRDIDKWLPGIKTIKLEINYRSTDEVIARSQRLIGYNYEQVCKRCNGDGVYWLADGPEDYNGDEHNCEHCQGTGIIGGPYPHKFMKNATGIKGSGEAVQFQMYDNAEHEALEIANHIDKLSRLECEDCNGKGYRYATENDEVKEGEEDREINCNSCNGLGYFQEYNPGDFFIGARTRAQLGYIEGALVRAQIPFINITGGSFWQSKHIADVIGYLRLANDTSNKEALERVYNIASANHKYGWTDNACKKCKGNGVLTHKKNNYADKVENCDACKTFGYNEPSKFQKGDYCSFRGLGKEFLAKINYNFENIDKILLSKDGWRYQTKKQDYAILGPTKAQNLQEFVWMLKGVIGQAENVGQVIQVIIDDCYEKYLKSQGMGDDGLSNAKLEDLATVEEIASQYTNIDKFLSYVAKMVEAAEKAKNKNWGDFIVISTIHRLKGLERPVVFGIGWCEGTCEKTGRDVGLLPHTFSLSPPPNFGVLPGGGMSPMEDERCIGFVLVSRAIERCYLSGIKSYRSYQMGPSRFIYEMELIDNETN